MPLGRFVGTMLPMEVQELFHPERLMLNTHGMATVY